MPTIIRNKKEFEQAVDNEVIESVMLVSGIFTWLGMEKICNTRIHTADAIWRSGMSVKEMLSSEHVPPEVKSVVRKYDAISKMIESTYYSVFDQYVEGTLDERRAKTVIPDDIADRHVDAYIDFISSGVTSLLHMRWILRCLERNKDVQKLFFKRMAYLAFGTSVGTEMFGDIIEMSRSKHGRSWTNIYTVSQLMVEVFSTGKISVLTGEQRDKKGNIILDEIDKYYRVFEARYHKMLLLSRDEMTIREQEMRGIGKKISEKIKEDVERLEEEKAESDILINSIIEKMKISPHTPR